MAFEPFTHRNAQGQAYDEHDFDYSGDSGGSTDVLTEHDNGDPVYWDTHPASVDALFQAQEFDFSSPVSLTTDMDIYKTGLTLSDYLANFPDAYALTNEPVLLPPASSVASRLASDPQSTTPVGNVAGPAMATASATVDQDTLLRTLREAGYGYSEIAEEMHERLGVKITTNALVKRYQKMPKAYERLLAEALTNIMPKIINEVKAQLPHIDDGTLSREEKQALDQLVDELPQILPKCIRGRLPRRRRAMQPSARASL